MAEALEGNRQAIQKANSLDMEGAAKSGLSAAMLDRLKLDEKRTAAMAKGVREVAALPDLSAGFSMNACDPMGSDCRRSPHPSEW